MADIIRVFDIETTGIDPKDDRVVEIAAYDLHAADRSIAFVGSRLCNPGRKIPSAASAVHHLIDSDVAEASPFGRIWPEFCSPEIKVYAAHNSEFEASFMPTPADVEWVCTFKSALHAWPDAPAHNNQTLRYWRAFDGRPGFDRNIASLAHRAGPDAYVTAHLLGDLLQVATVSQLIACTKQPKRYPTLSFGKHRGMKWADVPADYLAWLRDGKHDMDADWRHCAKRELIRRANGGE
jgi:exodeoxyribonuclease X